MILLAAKVPEQCTNSRTLGRRDRAFGRHCLHPGNSTAAAESRHQARDLALPSLLGELTREPGPDPSRHDAFSADASE